jgi:hypothetical protein
MMTPVLIAQQLYAAHLASIPLADVPNPKPAPPPGLQGFGNDVVSWMKYIGIIACLGGLIACGIMMAVGRRNRNEMSTQGALGLPWVMAGMAVIGGAAGIVGSFALG